MKTIEILIVTRSVVLQQGLGALLESLPGVTRVKAITNLQSAYAWIREHAPTAVLLDEILLGRNPEAALQKVRELSPETKRLLLVNDANEVKVAAQHVEAILIKGISPSALAGIVTNLLSTEGDDHVDEK